MNDDLKKGLVYTGCTVIDLNTLAQRVPETLCSAFSFLALTAFLSNPYISGGEKKHILFCKTYYVITEFCQQIFRKKNH